MSLDKRSQKCKGNTNMEIMTSFWFKFLIFWCKYSVHCMKSVQIKSHFSSVFSCILTEYRKIRTRNNSLFRHFSCSVWYITSFVKRLFFKNNYLIFQWSRICRRSRPEVFIKKGVLKICSKFTGEHKVWF